METLVQTAKRLGIRPNPNMTLKEFEAIRSKIRAALKLGISPNLGYSLYNKRRHGVLQNWDKKALRRNITILKSMTPKGISVHDQDGAKVSLHEDATFVWHSARPKTKDYIERFMASIRLDDPNLSSLYGKLDDFIKKYQAGFKITDVGHADRTDTLNVYMTQPITPEIAKEFYGIVMPFLKKENHEFLDGFLMKNHGREIQGIKYGPEPNVWGNLWKTGGQPLCKAIRERAEARLKELPPVLRKNFDFFDIKDAGSLGTVAGNVRYLNLLYYLAGREGQNPFQLGNQYGLPFNVGFSPKIARQYIDKKMDISTAKTPVKAPVSRPVSRPSAHAQVQSGNIAVQDVLQSLSSLGDKIQSVYSQILRFRQENMQLREMFTGLKNENLQLRSQNQALRRQIQVVFPPVTKKASQKGSRS